MTNRLEYRYGGEPYIGTDIHERLARLRKAAQPCGDLRLINTPLLAAPAKYRGSFGKVNPRPIISKSAVHVLQGRHNWLRAGVGHMGNSSLNVRLEVGGTPMTPARGTLSTCPVGALHQPRRPDPAGGNGTGRSSPVHVFPLSRFHHRS